MHVVLLGGSPAARSRTELLLDYVAQRLVAQQVEVSLLRVRDFPAEDLLHARFDSPAVQQLQATVARADGLVVGTPVYKASLTGALKVLLDLLPERALAHKVVLPLASGGSPAHLLAVDYALKPVLAALKAQEPNHDTRPEFKAPVITWTPVISPSSMIFYSGELFPEWKGNAFIGGLSSQALVRVAFEGDRAWEAERFAMGSRIREVEQGPDGALWLLEDGKGGRLLKLTPPQ